MITKKIIKVPIYDYKVTIIVSDTFEEANKLYPEMHQCNACVLESPTESVIVIPPNQLGILAHECVHLKNNIWTYIGYKPTSDNDEVDAYLIQYLYNEVYKVVDKHISATQC